MKKLSKHSSATRPDLGGKGEIPAASTCRDSQPICVDATWPVAYTEDENLKIIHSYVDLLHQKETAKSDFLPVDLIRQEAGAADEFLPLIESEASVNSLKDDTQSQFLVTRREEAVLRAE